MPKYQYRKKALHLNIHGWFIGKGMLPEYSAVFAKFDTQNSHKWQFWYTLGTPKEIYH